MSLLAQGRFLTIVPASALRFPTARPDIKILPVELNMARVPVGIVSKDTEFHPVRVVERLGLEPELPGSGHDDMLAIRIVLRKDAVQLADGRRAGQFVEM